MQTIVNKLKECITRFFHKITLRKVLIILDCIIFMVSLYFLSAKLYDYYSSERYYKKVSKLYDVTPEPKKDIVPSEIQTNEMQRSPIIAKADMGDKQDKEPKISDKFNDLLKINKETVGWISIEATHINYPVVKHQNNDYYLNRNFENKKNSSGCIFMDFRNSILPLDSNIILYGHHMKDKSMFRDITLYTDKTFFENHDIITFNTLYEEHEWQVFSVYVTGVNFDYLVPKFDNEKAYTNYLNTIKAKSLYKKDIQLSATDHILTLSTCSYEFTEARTVVHAKLIK